MKFLAPLAIITVGLASPAAAAVSGFYDSASQIEAVMQSGEVADAVNQLPLQSIVRADDGALRWQVRTERCALIVQLGANAPQGIGKTTYAVKEVGTCR